MFRDPSLSHGNLSGLPGMTTEVRIIREGYKLDLLFTEELCKLE
jgi:hypothetical protein